MLKTYRLALKLVSLLYLLTSASLHAQAVFGSIAGNVTDASGSVIPQAKVVITDTGKHIDYNTTTNESGNYSQTHLIVGLYQVRVEAPGFQAYVQKNVNVEVDAVTQVNMSMTLGSRSEEHTSELQSL